MGGVAADLVRSDPPLHAWRISRGQWFWVVLVLAGVALAIASYVLLNVAPPPDRWPAYFATDPATGELVQPLTGDAPYQTLILKSWLDGLVPFVPWMAVPYLAYLLIAPLVVPVLNLAVGSFRRFLTVGLALIVGQLFLDLAYFLFQTNVVRDEVAGDDLAGQLVSLVWGNDPPFSGYPSGHCTWATIAIVSLWRLRHRIPVTAWLLMACLLPVYPATVMLRQHYLMDVYAGIFVGFASYWACMFLVERPRLVPATEPPLGSRRGTTGAPSTLGDFVPLATPAGAPEVVAVARLIPEPWGDSAPGPARRDLSAAPLPSGATAGQRAEAVATHNRCWELLDQAARSADEDAELLTSAFASRYHWLAAGGTREHVVADWMVSRAAAAVGEPDVAILFGRRALAGALAGHDQPAWLRASAYEGLARSYAVAGDRNRRDECMALARNELAAETDPADQKVVADQMSTVPVVPWSG